MTWNDAERRHREARYRIILRVAIVATLVGLALMVTAVVAGMESIFWFGLLLVSLGGLNAYRAASSTVKIIDMDHGGDWRRVDV